MPRIGRFATIACISAATYLAAQLSLTSFVLVHAGVSARSGGAVQSQSSWRQQGHFLRPAKEMRRGSRAVRRAWSAFEQQDQAQGKLRALGRMLRTAGGQLLSVVPTIVEGGESSATAGEDGDFIQGLGVGLQELAGAMLNGQVLATENLLLAQEKCQEQCSAILCQESMAALWGLLTVSPLAPTPQEALTSLSALVESYAERLLEAEDVLYTAASTLSAASRLFASPTKRPRRRAAAGAMGAHAAPDLDRGRISVMDITAMVEQAPRDERKKLMRDLARKFHPDRHPGREMEILPIFLHVQKLREEWSKWA